MYGNQQIPPDGDTSIAPPAIVSLSCLLALALILYLLRMYTRIRPVFKLAATDYIISAAILCDLIGFTSLILAIHYGFGRHTYYISQASQTKVYECLFVVEFFSFWASSLARISVAVMLLLFPTTRTWRWVLWILIFIQFGLVIASNIILLLQCSPIRAMWEYVPGAVCWTDQRSHISGYIYAAMGIVSDLVFAIMPMFFIWQMNRPVIERMLITVLMALGIVAAMAGALKIVYMSRFVLGHGDVLRQMMPLFLWFKVEEFVLAASACAPFLKAPIERTLSRFGIQKFQFVTPSLIECRQPASLISEAATDHTTKDKSAAEGPRSDAAIQSIQPDEEMDHSGASELYKHGSVYKSLTSSRGGQKPKTYGVKSANHSDTVRSVNQSDTV